MKALISRITCRKISGVCGLAVVAGASFYLTGYIFMGKFHWPSDTTEVILPVLFFMLLGVAAYLTSSRHMEERLEDVERRIRHLEKGSK